LANWLLAIGYWSLASRGEPPVVQQPLTLSH
jgi:hypothetical protein